MWQAAGADWLRAGVGCTGGKTIAMSRQGHGLQGRTGGYKQSRRTTVCFH